MNRLRGCSKGRAMALAIAVACPFFATAAQPQRVRTLGTFPWDTVKADVLVQHVSADRLVVQVMIPTEINLRSGDTLVRYKSRPLPTKAMEVWVLLGNGTVLKQTPRQPPKGAPPMGVGSAGTVYSFVTFGFESQANLTPVGVVVKMESHVYVFPWLEGGRL
jgi:hypothetical protein